MTQPPDSPIQPQELSYYQAPRIPTEPRSIQIISIFAIVIGSLILLCDAMGLLSRLITFAFATAGRFGPQTAFPSKLVIVFGALQSAVGLILGGALLAGGIGGLQVRAWARQLLITWAIATLCFQVLSLALNVYIALSVTLPAAQTQIRRQFSGGRGGMMFVRHVAVGGAIGSATFYSACGCILPICVLIYWRRAGVIQAFEQPQPSFG